MKYFEIFLETIFVEAEMFPDRFLSFGKSQKNTVNEGLCPLSARKRKHKQTRQTRQADKASRQGKQTRQTYKTHRQGKQTTLAGNQTEKHERRNV